MDEPRAPAHAVVVGGCPVIVERDAPLRVLDEVAARARGGHAQLIVLTGEAGAGKSRLARDAAASFGPAWRVERLRFGREASPFAALIGVVTAEDAPGRAIGAALGNELRRRAESAPHVIVLDDLERADPLLIGALGYALLALGDAPVVLLATFRIDRPNSEQAAAVADLLREEHAHELRVELLTPAGVRAMAAAMEADTGAVDLDAIYSRTGGNPFFVEELLHAPASEMPWTVREAITARLGAMSIEARDVAQMLACAVDPLPRHVVELVAQDGVAELLADGMAVESESGLVGLRHGLVGDVVATTMSATERRARCRRVAALLESESRPAPAQLAHLWRDAGDPARGARWAVAAADAAAAGRQYRTAADLYRLALADAAPHGGLERAGIFDRAAVAAGAAGLGMDAYEWATQADALYRAEGEEWRAVSMWLNPALTHVPKPVVDPSALEHDAIPRLLAETHAATLRHEYAAACALAGRVLDLADESTDAGLMAKMHAARRLVAAGRLDDGERELRRLRAVATATGRDTMLSHLLIAESFVAVSRGDLYDCLSFNRQALQLIHQDEQGAWAIEVGIALVLAYLGELDEADAHARTLRARGDALITEFTQLPSCLVDLERNNLESARHRLDRLQAVYALGVADFTGGVLLARARWHLATDRYVEALADAEEMATVTGDVFHPTLHGLLVTRMRAATALDDEAEMAATVAAIDDVANAARGPDFEAASAWAHGLQSAARGATADAVSAITAGAERFESAHRFRDAADAWADIALMDGADADTRDSARTRGRALAAARGLTRVLARIDGDDVPLRASGPLSVLSERQRQIAELVAAGRTNREIAATLFVSEHTVRNQLVDVFAKLGVSRRTEIAALVARQPAR